MLKIQDTIGSADVPPVASEAIAIGTKALWLQRGITHAAACARAQMAGLHVVQDRCIKIEHARRAASNTPFYFKDNTTRQKSAVTAFTSIAV